MSEFEKRTVGWRPPASVERVPAGGVAQDAKTIEMTVRTIRVEAMAKPQYGEVDNATVGSRPAGAVAIFRDAQHWNQPPALAGRLH